MLLRSCNIYSIKGYLTYVYASENKYTLFSDTSREIVDVLLFLHKKGASWQIDIKFLILDGKFNTNLWKISSKMEINFSFFLSSFLFFCLVQLFGYRHFFCLLEILDMM